MRLPCEGQKFRNYVDSTPISRQVYEHLIRTALVIISFPFKSIISRKGFLLYLL